MSSSGSDSSQASSDVQQRTVRTSKRRILDHDDSSSDSSSGEESEASSNGEEQSNFLDLEAEESDEDSPGSGDDSDDGSSHMGGMNELPDREELYSFPQFARLPIELRHRIWDFVDPGLREPHRVFKFRLPISMTPRLCESELLERQTASARAVLSTHHESRAYALGFYPDEIAFESGNASVRYRKETDAILLAADWELLLSTHAQWRALQHAMSQVKHMALDVDLEAIDADIPQSFIDRKLLSLGSSIAPSLDAFYIVKDDNEFRGEDIKWCVTDVAYSFHLQTEAKEEGLGEDFDCIFCWPDSTKEEQLGYVRKNIDQTDDGENEDGDADIYNEDGSLKGVLIHNDKVAMYPMIQFSFNSGLVRYKFLKSVNSRPGGWDKNWDPQYDANHFVFLSADEDSELDEYESEGIDDSPIEDSDGDSDEDSGMVYHDGDSDDDGPDNLSGPVSYMSAGSSPAQSTTMEALAPAKFSDPESSESSDQNSDDGTGDVARPTRPAKQRVRRAVADSDDDDNETPDEEPAPPRRRKRAVVSDSDDDDEASELEQPQPSRRRKREVLSDSDGDDEPAKTEEPRPLKRQKHVLVSDSESDDDETVERRDPTSRQRKRIAVPESDEDSADSDGDSVTEAGSAADTSGSDEESSEEEDERPKKKASLAERLHLFRSQVPAAPSPGPGSDADSDMAQLRNGDYDEPDAHSDDAADIDDMDEVSANEAWDGAEGDSEGDSAW